MLQHLDAYTAAMAIYNSLTADHTEALAAQLDSSAAGLRTAVETEPLLAGSSLAPLYLDFAHNAEWCAGQVRRALQCRLAKPRCLPPSALPSLPPSSPRPPTAPTAALPHAAS